MQPLLRKYINPFEDHLILEDLEVVAVAAAFVDQYLFAVAVVPEGVAVGFFFVVASVAVVAEEVFAAELVFVGPGPVVLLVIVY